MLSLCLFLFPTLSAPYMQSKATQLWCCVGIPNMPLLIVTLPKTGKLKNYSRKYALLQIASVLLPFLCQTLIKMWSIEQLFSRFRNLVNQVLGSCHPFCIFFFFLYLKTLAPCFLTQPKITELDTLEAVFLFFFLIYCISCFFWSKYYCSLCLFHGLNKI